MLNLRGVKGLQGRHEYGSDILLESTIMANIIVLLFVFDLEVK